MLSNKKSRGTFSVQFVSPPKFVKKTRYSPIPNEIPVTITINRIMATLVLSIILFKEFVIDNWIYSIYYITSIEDSLNPLITR